MTIALVPAVDARLVPRNAQTIYLPSGKLSWWWFRDPGQVRYHVTTRGIKSVCGKKQNFPEFEVSVRQPEDPSEICLVCYRRIKTYVDRIHRVADIRWSMAAVDGFAHLGETNPLTSMSLCHKMIGEERVAVRPDLPVCGDCVRGVRKLLPVELAG